jgi:arabinofuranosyltransferase
MGLNLTRKERIALSLLLFCAFLAVYAGWRLFWFLTDDAYIAFRYVSNSQLGYGYVWNAPPFRPVEGYTSFLWVALLDMIWRLTGGQPPQTANGVALLFAYLNLLLGAFLLLRLRWHERLRRYRVVFVAVVLAGTIANRTFLAWASSGLETAMFNFFLTLWVVSVIALPMLTWQWFAGVTTAAALTYLTRPDGILVMLASIGLITLAFCRGKRSSAVGYRDLIPTFPLLLPFVHLLWRHGMYGEWLPNTYYAKAIAGRIWLASGARYSLSFVVEYSLWFWVAALFVLLGTLLLRRQRSASLRQWLSDISHWGAVIVVLTLTAHFLYYTVLIGGDHFEFRVYSHLILLLFVSFVWMLNALRLRAILSALLLVLFVAASLPIPWLHWAITHDLTTREQTIGLQASTAQALQARIPSAPVFLISYLQFYDEMQRWLISRAVCTRHQEHKVFHETMIDLLVSRQEGMLLSGDQFPVLAYGSVGVVGWTLPRVNVIDELGLNDYVIARNPELSDTGLIAHERQAPPGYTECFSPNVTLGHKQVVIQQRPVEMTRETIVECERHYSALLHTKK